MLLSVYCFHLHPSIKQNEKSHLVHLGFGFLLRTRVNFDIQRLKESKRPVEVQAAEVSAVHVVQQVTQKLAPLVVAIAQVEAGLQREEAGSAGDQVVGVEVDPRPPLLEFTVGDKQPFLT